MLLALLQPGLLIRYGQRIQVLRRRGCIVHPLSQQWTAVDDIDGEPAVLVFVGEIAPERIVRIQTANRLERERLETPRPEGCVIVAGIFGVDLYPVAKLADMFVKGRLEGAMAQAATA